MKLKICYTIISLVGLSIISSCQKKKETIQPEVKTLTESVYAAGKIKSKEQYTVYSTVNGILNTIRIKPGDTVQLNEVLFKLENVTSGLNSENARLAYEFSETNSNKNSDRLEELKLNVSVAKNKLRLDSLLYVKQKNLWTEKIGTQIDFEQKEMNFKTSNTNLEIAQKKYLQVKEQLQNETKRAAVNYSISKKIQNDYVIRSSISGTVYDVLKEEGELITPQNPLAIIGLTNQFYIEIEVDEKDIARIKPNQAIEVVLDSYKGKVFTAKISSIYPIMNERSRTFTVKAEFTEVPPVLYPNLSVEANIIISSKKNARIIPTSFLVNDSTLIVSPDKIRKIKIGLKNYDFVEIIEGLSQTDFIQKP